MAKTPTHDYVALATAAGWRKQKNGDWLRAAGSMEPANEVVGLSQRAISVTSAEEACEWDNLRSAPAAPAA